MADFTGALIGGGITTVVAGGGVIYGYGRLIERVDALKESVAALVGTLESTRKELVFSIEKMDETLVTLRERVAKLEGPSIGDSFSR